MTDEDPTRKRPRKRPTLAGVAKQAAKAGIDVARYEVAPDGTITIVIGKPRSAPASSSWDDLDTGTRQ
jgi:hypothetical protein